MSAPNDQRPELLIAIAEAEEVLRAAISASQVGDIGEIRSQYYIRIQESVLDYLRAEGGGVSKNKNEAKRAAVELLPMAFYTGYVNAGGEDTEAEDEEWLTGRINQEIGFIDDLFAGLRDKKKQVESDADAFAIADQHAQSYANTIDGVYNRGALLGDKNKMLTWNLGETEKHCPTCSSLDGTRHSAAWWIKNDLIPGESGNENLNCGGWNCQCFFTDDEGEIVSIVRATLGDGRIAFRIVRTGKKYDRNPIASPVP